MKTLSLALSISMSLVLLTGCGEENGIRGDWKSGNILPLEGDDPTLAYLPTQTTMSISEKYIQFMDSNPMEFKSSISGDNVGITIDKKSLLEKEPIFGNMLSSGTMKKDNFQRLQSINCSIKDSKTMKCILAEYWTASIYKVIGGSNKETFSQNTYSTNRYKHKEVLFTRVVPTKGD